MERAQASQPMPRPPTPLLPGRRRRRLCRKPLSALGGFTPPRISPGRRVTMDANAAVDAANAAAANTADANVAPDVFPTADAPLHTAAAIDVVPTASAAAVS